MKTRLKTIILFVLLTLAAGWGILWYMRKTIVPELAFQNDTLLLTAGNSQTSINELKGHVAIVSFFQTWCGPCIAEMYEFEELLASVNSPQFKVLCISDEDTNRINRLQGRFAGGKIMFAQSTNNLAGMGIHVYPTTYLLNKKGEVIISKLEGYNWALEKETIEKLLAE